MVAPDEDGQHRRHELPAVVLVKHPLAAKCGMAGHGGAWRGMAARIGFRDK